MERKKKTLQLLVTGMFVLIAFGMRGQGGEKQFLVSKETSKEMVFVVDGFQAKGKSIDSLSIGKKNFRAMYNGCGKMYLVLKNDGWGYSLDSLETNIHDLFCEWSLSSLRFSSFLRHAVKDESGDLFSRFGEGRSELKCNESYCVIYHLGLRINKGFEDRGEEIYDEERLLFDGWHFDFFREKYLVLLGLYNQTPIQTTSHLYFFDLERKQLLWNHKLQNDKRLLDVKVVGNQVYIVFRKAPPEGDPVAPPPSRCVVANIGSLGLVPEVTIEMVDEFDGAIVEIL